jgi:hypothetical protein
MINFANSALPKSGKCDLWLTFRRPFLASVLALVIFAGGAFAVLLWTVPSTTPTPLSFQHVFKETAQAEFESRLLKEIDKNMVLEAYKRSLIPTEPLPPGYCFYAYTKPLGQYFEGKAPKAFECRVWCEGDKVRMTVYLFLRHETAKGSFYEILPPSSQENPAKSFSFSIPEARANDHIIAIGFISFPSGEAVGDLNAIIHLEGIK